MHLVLFRHFVHYLALVAMIKRNGFTLIEVSIVMVIIGLVASGVLLGKLLIRQAELRAIATDMDAFITAAQAFKIKYGGFPGDIADATTYWPAADPNPAICATTPSVNNSTCNGNGNGDVDNATNEMFRFWQQLGAAEMIRGRYTGVAGPANAYHSIPGVNTPSSKLHSLTYLVREFGQWPGNGSTFATFYGTMMDIGLASNGAPQGFFLEAQEAYNIDLKIDDGKPGQGRLLINGWATCTDAANQNDLNANYKATSTDRKSCSLIAVKIF